MAVNCGTIHSAIRDEGKQKYKDCATGDPYDILTGDDDGVRKIYTKDRETVLKE